MEELFKKQPFYSKLDENTKKLVLKLFKTYKKKKMINSLSLYTYLLIGIIFLISFKELIFYKYNISNMETLFQLCKYLAIITAIISIFKVLTEKTSKDYEKSVSKLKSYLIFDITCICCSKCTCKKDLIKFLNSLGFYLI